MPIFRCHRPSNCRCSRYAVPMARIHNSDGGQGGTARRWLIVSLMSLILVLVFGMAWQANRSVQAHNETAVGVLRDYAGLAADEFARQAMAAAGYYGYYAVMNVLRAAAVRNPDDITVVDDQGDPETGSPSLYLFSVRLADQQISISSGYELPTSVKQHMLQELVLLVRGSLPDPGFVIEHVDLDGQQHSFAVSWMEDASMLFGFEVDRQWLSRTLQRTFEENVLLPESLAGGAVTNDLLYLQMRDSVGRNLFETGTNDDATALVVEELSDEYGGVFDGHTISAAIDPELAQALIIGGLPKSRLPIFVAVILLATGLLIAAVWQLQRENAVMQMRSNFVAEVSHELRTPLTQVRMFTESLLFERLRSPDDRRRALSIINRESQRLIHMVENILSFSDANRSRDDLALQVQDIGPLITTVVAEFQVLADATDTIIETSIQSGVIANVDADAMRQVLLNLLDNATKYGPDGQTVVVELSQESDTARIAVSDQGPGIPEAERERIWGGYYRLERERAAAIAGAGIGLAVVGELVSKHDGSVRVEDSERGGARFVIELPL